MKIHAILISFLFLTPSILLAEDLCVTANKALEIASKIRNLKSKKSVPCSVEDKKQIEKFLIETIDKEVGDDYLKKMEALYKKLNLIPKDSNYKQLLISLYKEQVAGYYDNYNKRYVMASWIPASMQLPVAVHEQTHAIQDQYFHLTSFLDLKTMSTDELMARQALVEGEASAVMSDYSNQIIGAPSLIKTENINSLIIGNLLSLNLIAAKNKDVASILQFLIFSYTSGLHFVHDLIKGASYDVLNNIYQAPPTSTEEILHPEKYLLKNEKVKIEIAEILEKFNIKKEDILISDTLGEFFLTVVLENNNINAADKTNASSGWAGDKVILLKNNKLYWYILWDSKEERDEFIKKAETIE
jgi:hypothetical protein